MRPRPRFAILSAMGCRRPSRPRQRSTDKPGKPRPAVATRGQGIGLGEVLKQFRLLFGAHADAAVRNRKLDPLASVRHLARPRATSPSSYAGFRQIGARSRSRSPPGRQRSGVAPAACLRRRQVPFGRLRSRRWPARPGAAGATPTPLIRWTCHRRGSVADLGHGGRRGFSEEARSAGEGHPGDAEPEAELHPAPVAGRLR